MTGLGARRRFTGGFRISTVGEGSDTAFAARIEAPENELASGRSADGRPYLQPAKLFGVQGLIHCKGLGVIARADSMALDVERVLGSIRIRPAATSNRIAALR